MTLVSEAVLRALEHYISHGGGSRGARAICSELGTQCPEAHRKDLSRYRFIAERETDQDEKLVASLIEGTIKVSAIPVDRAPTPEREFFEKGWGPYLLKEG